MRRRRTRNNINREEIKKKVKKEDCRIKKKRQNQEKEDKLEPLFSNDPFKCTHLSSAFVSTRETIKPFMEKPIKGGSRKNKKTDGYDNIINTVTPRPPSRP